MSLPPWLVALVGTLVMVFGLYRLWFYLRLRREAATGDVEQEKSVAAVRRTHLMFSVIYLALGVLLIARALGK